jgi:tetratricopeptide (TPR) repeat protein
MASAALLPIIAYARAGALDQAWRLFEAAGFGETEEQADVACVRGRLLKDLADRCTGFERRRLWREAAEAYGRAAANKPASYPLINAATLFLLAGDGGEAARLAAEALELIELRPDEPETAYWRSATQAEALLLLDREYEARAAFAEAVSLAPQAWEDQASTLRQFTRILEAQDKECGWLEAHRPPRSLHFGGHMSFDPKVGRREHLDEKIAAVLEEERVGFGYGALAAGADIIIAEALLERGAEVHAVLPGGADAFAKVSVDPLGKRWRRRFDVVLGQAASVRPVRPLGAEPDTTMIGLADEIAMGAALINARRLESQAVQLLVLADGASGRAREAWAQGGRPQRIICAPREETPDGLPPTPRHPWKLLAVLTIAVEEQAGESAELEARLGSLHRSLMAAPPAMGPVMGGRHVMLAWESPLDAARAAIVLKEELVPEMPLRIGGHYGVAECFRDPFSGSERPTGDSVAAAEGALSSTPPGTAYVTEDFAAALMAAGPEAPRTEYIGELDPPDDGPPVGLYVLKS